MLLLVVVALREFMVILLVAIIYAAFISLGLPDAVLGATWSVMRQEMQLPIYYQGIISTIISVGTIVSSLMSNFTNKKLGAGLVTALSTLLTAVALFGFSCSTKFWQLCLFAIPCGLGAGGVDASLNNYVAVNLSSRHMNWLHCCWGVGATIGPQIMGNFLSKGMTWNNGYLAISIIQGALTLILLFSLPLWKKAIPQEEKCNIKTVDAIKIKGVWLVLIMFFCYCAAESLAMLWASSYLVEYRHVDSITATLFGSLFFVGMTVGRFVCGLFSGKLGDKALIRIGCCIALVGVVAIMLPIKNNWLSLLGLVIFGLGCAPIYPAIIHSTPTNFGKQNSQAIVGFQMAFAYTGSTLVPLVFGFVTTKAMVLFPYIMAVCFVLVLLLHEKINHIISARKLEVQ